MTKVINLFAGPGAGKSTTAAGLFNLMKMSGEKVELVTEYAKDLTYERSSRLSNQLTILGEQFQRMHRLVGQVDWIITDSPLLLGLMYSAGPFKSAGFAGTCLWAFDEFENHNFFIQRAKAYQTFGRSQTAEEAVGVDTRVRGLLEGLGVSYTNVMGDAKAPGKLYDYVRDGVDVVSGKHICLFPSCDCAGEPTCHARDSADLDGEHYDGMPPEMIEFLGYVAAFSFIAGAALIGIASVIVVGFWIALLIGTHGI